MLSLKTLALTGALALAAAPAVAPVATAAGPQAKPAGKVAYMATPSGDYTIDPAHSIIGFAIRHLEINWVEGRFKDFTGTVHFDGADATKSTVEFTAKVASIDTGVSQRDDHLKTVDFFDAATYPELSFKSTRVAHKAGDQYVMYGDLTMKGVTKKIEFPFTMTGAIKDPWGNTRFGVSAKTTIDRRDYNITWGHAMEAGGLDVGNDVTISLSLEAMKPGPKPDAAKPSAK